MDRSKLLLHQVVLSVSSVTEQDFMNICCKSSFGAP